MTTEATYCFEVEEGRYALFAEACLRGFLAAILDFPRFLNREECTRQAMVVAPSVLRSEVCCIPDEASYQQLTATAWLNAYQSLEQESEREITSLCAVLKGRPLDEALTILRPVFSSGQVRAIIDRGYAEFLSKR